MMKVEEHMSIYIKKLFAIFIFFSAILFIPSSVLAVTYDLINPTGQLVRGQDVQFTININTESKSIASAAIGMTYDTQYLEYISVTPGDTFTTVSADVQGGGKLIINGTSTSPYSGSGTFAYVTFKLIATQSGSTQLCVLFNPATSTPTPVPTSAPAATAVPGVTTYAPAPTSLPKTGESGAIKNGIVLGSFFFLLATGGFFVFKKI